MKKETLFIGAGLMTAIAAAGIIVKKCDFGRQTPAILSQTETKYGAFLAAQHALYVNDFDRAVDFASSFSDVEYASVQSVRYLSEFLSGKLPDNANTLGDEKSMPARIMYDAYLVKNSMWDELYRRHKKDESALIAPLRIWASVATNRRDDALKFIDGLLANASYKAFVRGQVYAETGDVNLAADEFIKVSPEFMNINDYLYMMSFYRHNGMDVAADALRADFTARPGGMFMLKYNSVPGWATYSGYSNALAFSMVQNVSHTQVMLYSDIAILLLQFAHITSVAPQDTNAINYYLGQYFFNNSGDWKRYFDKIEQNSPFYSFATLRRAEYTGNIADLERVADANPLFVPVINKIVVHNIQNGNRRSALRRVNDAINNKNMTKTGRAFFLKQRAQINFIFGDMAAAQADLHDAATVLIADADILSLQAKIWVAQNREIENAYEYAMTLVRKTPADICAWDTLGRVIAVRESADSALDLLSRVGDVADNCSSLFENLGDLYVKVGDIAAARNAYMRAIDLSDDGLVAVPLIEKKLRKLK